MKKGLSFGIIGFAAILVCSFFFAHSAMAAKIAVFGDNSIDNYLASQGHTVYLIKDMAFLEKPLNEAGSLNDYDVFIYTRDWNTYGKKLSPGAAANVQAFVAGNVVLFMSDMADMIDNPEHPAQAIDPEHLAEKALLNAVNFVSLGGKGYIGEFNGAASALTNNNSGDPRYGGLALGLMPGTFTGWNLYNKASESDILQPSHPVVAGLPNPWNLMGARIIFSPLRKSIPNTLWPWAHLDSPNSSPPLSQAFLPLAFRSRLHSSASWQLWGAWHPILTYDRRGRWTPIGNDLIQDFLQFDAVNEIAILSPAVIPPTISLSLDSCSSRPLPGP
jgi:hypothetical protein